MTTPRVLVPALAICALLAAAPIASAQTYLPNLGEPVLPEIDPPPWLPGGQTCQEPEHRALLVLMENGGMNFGLPDNVTVKRWYCASFERYTLTSASVSDVIAALLKSLRSVPSCLRPSNWHSEYVTIAEMAERVTDQNLEELGVSMVVQAGAYDVYDEVVILEDEEFVPDTVLSVLEWFAANGYLVDIHILAHGGRNYFCGYGTECEFYASPVEADDFFDRVEDISCLSLGVIYQQNCFGESLNDDWLDAGAIAVTGAPGINSMPFSYGDFLSGWLSGGATLNASEGAYLANLSFSLFLYRHVDLFASDSDPENWARRSTPTISLSGSLSATDELNASRMVVEGDAGATIDDF